MITFKMNTFCRNNICDLGWKKKESSHYNTSYACVNIRGTSILYLEVVVPCIQEAAVLVVDHDRMVQEEVGVPTHLEVVVLGIPGVAVLPYLGEEVVPMHLGEGCSWSVSTWSRTTWWGRVILLKKWKAMNAPKLSPHLTN